VIFDYDQETGLAIEVDYFCGIKRGFIEPGLRFKPGDCVANPCAGAELFD
jgi:hypothetical protein